MSGAIKKVTPNYALFIPRFDSPNWAASMERNFDILDAAIFASSGLGNIVGVWDNAITYADGDRVYDSDNFTLWQSTQDHVSAATGTFLGDRTARPSLWNAISSKNVYRSVWQSGVQYLPNEFVSTLDGRYGVCVDKFISGATYDADETAGKIITLIDLRSVIADATASKNAAKTSETNAKASETNSATSATSANNSKNAAATSASIAATSETNAASSASTAVSAKDTAVSASSSASSSASNASTSAGNAADSAIAAGSSAGVAITQANRAEAEADRAEQAALSVGDPVSYNPQTPTTAQQTQARTNIGVQPVNASTVGATLATPTPSETITDSDRLSGLEPTGTDLKLFRFSAVKTWIQSWLTKAMVGLGNVANKTEAQMVASGEIADALGGKQPALWFTPVQQGGFENVSASKVNIGWSSTGTLNVKVDAMNFGDTWPIHIQGAAASLGGVWTPNYIANQLNWRLTDTRFNGYIEHNFQVPETGNFPNQVPGANGYIVTGIWMWGPGRNIGVSFRQPQVHLINSGGWRPLGTW